MPRALKLAPAIRKRERCDEPIDGAAGRDRPDYRGL